MRILEMLSNHHWTGPAEQVLGLARGLADLGHRVDVAVATVPAGSLPARVRERGLPLVEALHLYKRRFAPLLIAADVRWLRAAFREGRYDLVHCHHSHDHTLALLARGHGRRRPPIVRTVHHSDAVRRRRFQGALYRRTDGLIAISEAFGESLARNFGLPGDRIAVIRGAVDTERFRPPDDRAAARERYGFSSGDFLIGIVSRIKPGRGHAELVEAFSRIARDLPDARLAIIGRGESRSEIEYQVQRLGLPGRVRFLGYLGDDLPVAVGMLDVKVLLGEGSDGSCRAAVEALACGVPVIAAPVGTMPETIRDGRTGFLLPSAGVEPLTSAILLAARRRTELPEMGRAARADVLSRFTEEIRARKTLAYFERVLAR